MTPDRRVVPFKPWHYQWLADGRKSAEGGAFRVGDDVLWGLCKENWWTGFVDGEVLVCAGTMQQWPGRHTAHAYIARGTLPHMRWITEEVKKALDLVKGRIEFTVRVDFAPGVRWAKALGFETEALLRKYGPEGEDHFSFVRFN